MAASKKVVDLDCEFAGVTHEANRAPKAAMNRGAGTRGKLLAVAQEGE